MDHDEDIVPTSDPEELEELAANQPDYWMGATKELGPRSVHSRFTAFHNTPTTAFCGHTSSPSTLSLSTTRRISDGPTSASGQSMHAQKTLSHSPPRKRRKLLATFDSPSYETPLLSRTNLPSSPFITSGKGSPPTPYIDAAVARSPLSKIVAPISPSPSVGAYHAEKQVPLAQPSTSFRQYSTGSPSSSPDPLLLLTPPRRSRSPWSQSAALFSPISSPLTPESSPAKPETSHLSPSPTSSQHISPDPFDDDEPLIHPGKSPPPTPPSANNQATHTAIEQAQAEERSRYSLRTRNARQLNPYEFDKLVYKRQMRANPDAIVKVISPPRVRRRQRSTSLGAHSSDVDDEYLVGDEADAEEDIVRRRWKGKARAIETEESGDNGERTHKSSWLPDALQESSSSSDDDELMTGLDKPRQQSRKRLKPFPMNIADFPHSVSPVESPRKTTTPPPPRSRPRPRPRARVTSGPPMPTLPKSPTAELEVSRASSPVDQHNSIPTLSQNRETSLGLAMAPWGGDYRNVFDDEFSRAQSPMKLSQLGGYSLAEASSEPHEPPTTPSEVIEIGSSESDSGDSRARFRSSSSSSSRSMVEEDRKRMKVLNRMMPKVMINQLEANTREKITQRRAVVSVERDEEERPLRPGESRKRVGGPTMSSRSIDFRGDSESSDIDIGSSRDPSPVRGPGFPSAMSSDSDGGANVIEPIGHQPRPKYRPSPHVDDVEDISSSDISDVEDAVDRWVSGSRKHRLGPDTQVKERDLIDRMLSRTNVSSTRKRRRAGMRRGNSGTRTGGDGGHRRSTIGGRRPRDGRTTHRSDNVEGKGSSQLHVVTAGARRAGGQQTLLDFLPLAASEDNIVLPAPRSPPENEVVFTGDDGKAKLKAAKLKARNTGVYVFPGAGGHLTSGRANASHVTINQEVVASRGHLRTVQPARLLKSKPTVHHDFSNTPRPTTLEEYWIPADDHYEHDGFLVPDTANAEPEPEPRQEWDNVHRIQEDLGVLPLLGGVSFPHNTYLGHGWLHELVNLLPGTHDIISPPPCSLFGWYLHNDMSAADFLTCLESIIGHLRTIVLDSAGPADTETCRQWQTFLHSVSQHISMLLIKTGDTEHAPLTANVESLVRQLGGLMEEPIDVLSGDETPNPLVLQVLWFLLEVTCRIASDKLRRSVDPDKDAVSRGARALLDKLWDHAFGESVSFELTRESLTQSAGTQQLAEVWVCFYHLCSDNTVQERLLPSGDTFWSMYLHNLEQKGYLLPQAKLEAREATWKSIFSLCIISQFSMLGIASMVPKITPSWQVVASILEHFPLSADPVVDVGRPKSTLRKRDRYVRTLVSRCLLLHLKWNWRLDVDNSPSMFNRLLQIFKSRKFASLLDEESDLPGFLRHNNLGYLQERRPSDTAFTLFLKLVVRAAEDMRKNNAQVAQSEVQKLKKILSLAVPVGAVTFTKANPPTTRELSMLYNRFSAVAVTIYLEPVHKSVEYRIARCARYVVFRDADNETRRACIRGAMHLGILLRHLRLPLSELLVWLAEMTDILIDEYQTPDTVVDGSGPGAHRNQRKDWIVVSIQLLLGCVRHILETPSMDPDPMQREDKYPDPALVQGPWVTRVFSTATNLSTIASTSDEIRRLVQAFLDARARVIPRPPRPQPRGPVEDTQDSQDFGQFDLDLEDPELRAALGEDIDLSEYRANKEKEGIVCEIIDKHISPAIYRLVCKHFNDPLYQQKGELSFQDADRWIDCWVGCISVVVQNDKKDWSFYFNYGSQSWEKIIEPDWRRRVGLRFMYMLLKLDPPAYLTYTNQFIDVLFQSIATPNVTLDHEYAALLFSIDRLHHPLLRELPIDPPGEDGDYHVKKHEFTDKRLDMLESMLKNLSESLASERRTDTALTARNQIYLTSLMALLSTMKDIYDQLEAGTVSRALYVTFCKQVLDRLSRYPTVSTQSRLTALMHWLQNVS